ncbi:MAG: hypothetical protein ABIA76_04300 [Candidatus Diapherotrites archaeon]
MEHKMGKIKGTASAEPEKGIRAWVRLVRDRLRFQEKPEKAKTQEINEALAKKALDARKEFIIKKISGLAKGWTEDKRITINLSGGAKLKLILKKNPSKIIAEGTLIRSNTAQPAVHVFIRTAHSPVFRGKAFVAYASQQGTEPVKRENKTTIAFSYENFLRFYHEEKTEF